MMRFLVATARQRSINGSMEISLELRALSLELRVMMKIENNQACFVQLWQQLERTRQHLGEQCKHFCIRNLLKSWFGAEATDDFIWEVCHLASLALPDEAPFYGYDILPPPLHFPRRHRELLRAIVAVSLGIGARKVHLKELDAAYRAAFPHSKRMNVNKHKY